MFVVKGGGCPVEGRALATAVDSDDRFAGDEGVVATELVAVVAARAAVEAVHMTALPADVEELILKLEGSRFMRHMDPGVRPWVHHRDERAGRT